MSLHRRNPRRDANEAIIVDALHAAGFHIDRVSATGFPDLVVSRHGQVWLIEVKMPKGRMQQSQADWRKAYQGPPPRTIRSVEDAIQFAQETQDTTEYATRYSPPVPVRATGSPRKPHTKGSAR